MEIDIIKVQLGSLAKKIASEPEDIADLYDEFILTKERLEDKSLKQDMA